MKDEEHSTKICNTCEKEKALSEFRYQHNCCKCCLNLKNREYFKTKKGLVTKKYSDQLKVSRKRGYGKPEYTLNELREWALSQQKFHELYEAWKLSGYQKLLVPSFDRTDDYKRYSLNRLQIMTWQENKDKFHKDSKSGKNRKRSRRVNQISMGGDAIIEHYSQTNASRVTGISQFHIWSCCNGERKSAGGYRWSYV